MRGAWPFLVLAALLTSGCLSDSPPATPPQDLALSETPAFAGVTYGCPGSPEPSPTPCGSTSPLFAGYIIIDMAVRADPPLLALVGINPMPGVAGAAGAPEPSLMVFTSADGGATWDATPAPSFPSKTTRTGQRAPYWGSIGFGADGRLHLLVQLNADVERSVIGGAVPDQLQPQPDIGFVTSPDGRTWPGPVVLSESEAGSYTARLTVLPDGTLFASWMDYPGEDFVAAWSRDGGATWTAPAPVGGGCWAPTQAIVSGGRVLVACLNVNFLEPTHPPLLFAADLANGTVERLELALWPPPADPEDDGEGLPACGAVQMHARAGGLLLVLSQCPEIRLLTSSDGTWWNETAQVGPEQLALDGGWGSLSLWSAASAIDATGTLHSLLVAERMSTMVPGTLCYCPEYRFLHEAIDPATGAVLHGADLDATGLRDAKAPAGTFLAPLGIHTQMLMDGGRGWMSWPDGQNRVGWFDAQSP